MKKLLLKILVATVFVTASNAYSAEVKTPSSKKTTSKKTEQKKKPAAKQQSKTAQEKKQNTTKATKLVEDTQQKFIKKFDGWDLYKINDNSKLACFLTSSPTKETGTFKKRSQPYLLVTYRGKGTPEVSISAGYNYEVNSFVDVKIDGKKYDFFTSDKTPKVAWARDSKTDAEIITLMKKSSKLVVSANSTAKTSSTDEYSLKGFSAAADGLIKLCK